VAGSQLKDTSNASHKANGEVQTVSEQLMQAEDSIQLIQQDGDESKQLAQHICEDSVQFVGLHVQTAGDLEMITEVHAESKNLQQAISCGIEKAKMEDLKIFKHTELGRGAFGYVYLGKWLGTHVAVKELIVSKRHGKHLDTEIEKELNIHSQLKHINIVQLIAAATEGCKYYLLCEYINGYNLDTIIFDSTPIQVTDEFKRSVALQTARALAYLHGRSPMIIHQDLKPANIMVDKTTLHVKVCDFGLGRMRRIDSVSRELAQSLAGTAMYMAPECLVSTFKATESSDIWAFGCVIAELQAQSPVWSIPDDCDEDMFVFIPNRMKLTRRPDVIELLGSDQLSDIARKCLHFETKMRPTALMITSWLE
jgi:serine/threonine protein kinase